MERNRCLSGGSLELFIEPRLPPPLIAVAGSSPVARALREVARAAGLDACSLACADQPPGDAAAVILATHGEDEGELLRAVLRAGVPYVALLASRARGEAVRAALGLPAELCARLHTPAGLDIGARAPGEIAISILAEAIACLRSRSAPPLPAPPPAVAAGEAVDPICGMRVSVGARTPKLDTEAGALYFCSERCRSAYADRHEQAACAS